MKFSKWNLVWLLSGLLAFAGSGCVGGETGAADSGMDADAGNEQSDGPILCNTGDDCPDGMNCQGGVCAPADTCQCNYECDKSKNEVCNKATHLCETGSLPANCTDDCGCYSGEQCVAAQCVPVGGDEEPDCVTDGDCEDGEVCEDGHCVPELCQNREDCADLGCKVCVDGECVNPPPTCQGDKDCCVNFRCNFGTCVPENTGDCMSDADCQDPEFPRCVNNECVQECITDIDCPLEDQVCINNHCETVGCTPQTCEVGQWCDIATGDCLPGCDSNTDCTSPETCNYTTHECGMNDCCGGCPTGEYCDTLTCQCVEMCQSDLDCPANFECRPDGTCGCTPAGCPTGTTCNQTTGECDPDTQECATDADCPTGWICNQTTHTCESGGGMGEGATCYNDEMCDMAAGLLCDSSIFCMGCMLEDPDFAPTFTCRYECSLLTLTCSLPDRECKYRKTGFTGLCMPTTP